MHYWLANLSACLKFLLFWFWRLLLGMIVSIDYCNAPDPAVRRRYCDIYTREEIPSHIYAMHQYMQESEYESTMVIYISVIIAQVHNHQREWYNIPRILDHQEAQKHDMQYKKTEKYSRVVRWESREPIKGAGRKEGLDIQQLIHASAAYSDQLQ